MQLKTPKEVIVKAIMKRAGLSDFDREWVEEDAAAILIALSKEGYIINNYQKYNSRGFG